MVRLSYLDVYRQEATRAFLERWDRMSPEERAAYIRMTSQRQQFQNDPPQG
ncbi:MULTISPECIES: hypothetical protein [unclassified Mesorhizobium]|uniref:hypothetical protein n=1 Tax=unclassified Mesorhizobium TaxID=325217 RepID=UPI0015E29214|nr:MULTISPECIES: hypothetical protein [unclassified Mesorhizobium]